MPYKSPQDVYYDDERAEANDEPYYYRSRRPDPGPSVAIDQLMQPDKRRPNSPQTTVVREVEYIPSEPLYYRRENFESTANSGGRKFEAGATNLGNIQEIDRSKDLTVHLRLPITNDFDVRLDVFAQLVRLGDFTEADRYFREHLEDHLSHPYVFVQYAAMLLKRGDYLAFEQLNAEPVFGNDETKGQTPLNGNSERHLSDYYSDEDVYDEDRRRRSRRRSSANQTLPDQSDAMELLRRNWKLMQALSICHSKGILNDAAHEVQSAVHDLDLGDEICSTEVHIVVLVFQICALLAPNRLTDDNLYSTLLNWFDGAALYESLLAQGRIWDFADLYKASYTVFGTETTLTLFTRNLGLETVMDQWTLENDDESTTLAQLDMLSWALIQQPESRESLKERNDIFEKARSYAESIKTHHPKRMKSSPFITWLLGKTVHMSLKETWFKDHIKSLNSHLSDFPGLVCGLGFWSEPLFYVPRRSENPGRPVPNTPADANQPILAALKAAKQLGDYQTMAYGLDILIARSGDPAKPMNELLELQKKTQGDEKGYMFTLLMSYLTCTEPGAEKRLLKQLRDTPSWTDTREIRSHAFYFARDFMQRSLSIRLESPEGSIRLKASEMPYLSWLDPRPMEFAMRYADEPASPGRDYRSSFRDVPAESRDYRRGVPRPTSPIFPRPRPLALEDVTLPRTDRHYRSKRRQSSGPDTNVFQEPHVERIETGTRSRNAVRWSEDTLVPRSQEEREEERQRDMRELARDRAELKILREKEMERENQRLERIQEEERRLARERREEEELKRARRELEAIKAAEVEKELKEREERTARMKELELKKKHELEKAEKTMASKKKEEEEERVRVAAIRAIEEEEVAERRKRKKARRLAAEREMSQRLDRIEDLLRQQAEDSRPTDTTLERDLSEPDEPYRRIHRTRSYRPSDSESLSGYGTRSRTIAHGAGQNELYTDDDVGSEPDVPPNFTDLVLYDPNLPHVRRYNGDPETQLDASDRLSREEDHEPEDRHMEEEVQEPGERETRAFQENVAEARAGQASIAQDRSGAVSESDEDGWTAFGRRGTRMRSQPRRPTIHIQRENRRSPDRALRRERIRDDEEDREQRQRLAARMARGAQRPMIRPDHTTVDSDVPRRRYRPFSTTGTSEYPRERTAVAFDEEARTVREAEIRAEVDSRVRAYEERRRRQNQHIESRHSFSRERRRPEFSSEEKKKKGKDTEKEPQPEAGSSSRQDMIEVIEREPSKRDRRRENISDMVEESTGIWDAFQEISAKGKSVAK
ncbi:hypothetical protein diail_3833 [Diaporthe ilicicola]|nr:hypothetical protein diail_3833 [Diaporthe ilicicola]